MNTHLYEEIRSIEDIIKDNKPMQSERITTVDEYTKLINKEDKILDLLNDVYKKNNEEVNSTKYFVSSPIHVIIFKTFNTITKLINEISKKNDIFQVLDLILSKDNIIYVGISFVIFSFLLMFITI